MSENTIPASRYYAIGMRWADITIERMQREFPKHKINQGVLYKSFKRSVTANASGISIIRIIYQLYGMYVDMGVGKGMAIGARASASFSKYRNSSGQVIKMKRKPKKWYSPVMFHEQVMLMHIMADEFGDNAQDIIRKLPQRIEIQSPIQN